MIVAGGKGIEAALASLWEDVQRCNLHQERDLLAHTPKHPHND
jgi:hypothetical protein